VVISFQAKNFITRIIMSIPSVQDIFQALHRRIIVSQERVFAVNGADDRVQSQRHRHGQECTFQRALAGEPSAFLDGNIVVKLLNPTDMLTPARSRS